MSNKESEQEEKRPRVPLNSLPQSGPMLDILDRVIPGDGVSSLDVALFQSAV